MECPEKKRLTDNQRRLLAIALSKYDLMMRALISKAKDTVEMVKPEEKLSSNLEFKAKGHACFEKLSNYVDKTGVKIPIFATASKYVHQNLSGIVPGQSRYDVRFHLNCARRDFLFTMASDEVNVNIVVDGFHPDAPR